ncbi:hypothetical protein Dsin_009178 [Dipteronia sinensis]|uniref:Uncharacterized protein n=1 Tax=Dipteronia sinensis TaxID=43782 RepID=A0AAE0AQJ8_9ROSI|nr:hypothetical protein Dsin_009178 [Dipteronia sinensis]
MSVSEGTDQGLAAVPQSTPNWTINVSDIRTIKVSNISVAASESDIKEFFSFLVILSMLKCKGRVKQLSLPLLPLRSHREQTQHHFFRHLLLVLLLRRLKMW